MNRLALHIARLCARGLRWLACAAAACMAVGAMAQTDGQLTQYYEARTFYNPAATGNTDLLRLRGGSRMQWVGIKHAPQTFLGTADMPFKVLGKRIGVGAVAVGESYGLYSSLQLGAQFSYKFYKLGGWWSIGLQAGMYDQKFKGSDVELPDDDDYHQGKDDAVPTRDIHGTTFDMALGLWYQHPKFWAGMSCLHLMSPTVTLQSENNQSSSAGQVYEFQAQRTMYFMAGCNIPVKNTLFEVMPSMLMRSDFTFFSGEVTLRARYNKMFSFGLAYRYDDAVCALLGLEFKNFFLGYAYDYSTSAIAKATSGSHEVFLGYSMKLDLSDKNKNKHKSIRIM